MRARQRNYSLSIQDTHGQTDDGLGKEISAEVQHEDQLHVQPRGLQCSMSCCGVARHLLGVEEDSLSGSIVPFSVLNSSEGGGVRLSMLAAPHNSIMAT